VFVEAGGDGAIMLDLVEEPLDEVTAFVDPRAEGGRIDAMIEGADVGDGPSLGDHGAQRVAVIAAVGHDEAIARERAEHVLGALAVVGLTLGQLQRDRETAGVDKGVDFGRKPAAGTAHATTSAAFFSPLAAC